MTIIRRLPVVCLLTLALGALVPAAVTVADEGHDTTSARGERVGWAGAPIEEAAARGEGSTPAVRAVASVYPYFRGGSRDVYRSDHLDIRNRSCVYYGAGRPARVRWSNYADRTGGDPYFDRRDSPSSFVHVFRNARRAHAAVVALRRYVHHCEGRHGRSGTIVSMRRERAGGLGAEAVAWREISLDRRTGHANHSRQVYVRLGNRVVLAWVQHDGRSPDESRFEQWSRIAVRAAR